MRNIRAVIRVLTAGFATLGVGTFIYVITVWLNVESEMFHAIGIPFISCLIVMFTYLLSIERVPKEHWQGSYPMPSMFLIFVSVAVLVSGLIGYSNYVTSADLPEWLGGTLQFTGLVMGMAAMREWTWLNYTARREQGQFE